MTDLKAYLDVRDLPDWVDARFVAIPKDTFVLLIAASISFIDKIDQILVVGIGKTNNVIGPGYVKITDVEWVQKYSNNTAHDWTITHWKYLESVKTTIPLEL